MGLIKKFDETKSSNINKHVKYTIESLQKLFPIYFLKNHNFSLSRITSSCNSRLADNPIKILLAC